MARLDRRDLGREAARVAKNIHTKSDPAPVIDFVDHSTTLHLRWDPAKFKDALLKFLGPQGIELYGAPIAPEIHGSHYDAAHKQANRAIARFQANPSWNFKPIGAVSAPSLPAS